MSSDAPTDWFQRLFGFAEGSYAETQSRLSVEQGQLISKVNGKSYGIGRLEVTSLQELRRQAQGSGGRGGMHVSIIQGNVRQLHRAPEFRGALFQVASQFNLLEMTGPEVTPERGVTRYAGDRTQGPACAMAAGDLWSMRNGYAQCTRAGLEAISGWIEAASPAEVDEIRGQLSIGLHWDVEVTDVDGQAPPLVS